MYNVETEKKERRKVVIFAGVTVALILALIVAIVVVATNKAPVENLGGNDNSAFTISEEKKDATTESKTESKTSSKSTSTATAKTSPVATSATSSSSLPDTGPEDLTVLAGTLGVLTTAGTAMVMRRSH